jgi:hypothetical protein
MDRVEKTCSNVTYFTFEALGAHIRQFVPASGPVKKYLPSPCDWLIGIPGFAQSMKFIERMVAFFSFWVIFCYLDILRFSILVLNCFKLVLQSCDLRFNVLRVL